MKKVIPFLKFTKPAFVLSTLVIVGLFTATFLRGGFNLGIDFKSGLSLIVAIEGDHTEEAVNNALISIHGTTVQKGEGNNYIIRATDNGEENFKDATETAVTGALTTVFGPVEVLSSDFMSASSSSSMIYTTLLILLGAFGGILLYIWFRFKTLNYSLSAIISSVHDVLVVIGFIGAAQLEVNSATIAAVLTILGYSLNDTIVIFDRIREVFHLEKNKSFADMIDMALTQTLSRTFITGITTVLAILPLIFFAMGSVKLFAIEMLIGIVVGTYSSLFIASVSLNLMHEKHVKDVKKNTK